MKKIEAYLVATKDMKVERALTLSQIKELLKERQRECHELRESCPALAEDYLTMAAGLGVLACNLEDYID